MNLKNVIVDGVSLGLLLFAVFMLLRGLL